MLKVIDKIRKLQRHAESARLIGNVAEAEAFAARAQYLLIEHKLSQCMVDAAAADHDFAACRLTPDSYGEKPKRRRVPWTELLADSVSRAHFCRSAVLVGTNSYVFIGRKHDVEISVFVFTVLARTATRLAHIEADQARAFYRFHQMKWPGDALFHNSFCLGFAVAIARRFQARRAEYDSVHSHALILRREDEALNALVAEVVEGEARALKVPELEELAARRGYLEGEQAELDRAAIGDSDHCAEQGQLSF